MALPLNIEDLINARTVESVRVEFKKSWNPHSVLKTICAFANDINELGGGYIVVGIEENGGTPVLPPFGIPLHELDDIQKECFKLCQNNINPNVFPPIEVVELQGKHILIIWVTTGEQRPYFASNSLAKGAKMVVYVRHGTVTKESDYNQENQLRNLATFKHFDDRTNERATLGDFDLGLIQSYLYEVKSGLYAESLNLPIGEIALKMQISRGPKENVRPLNVGLLMFTKQPDKFFPGCKTNLIEFEDEAGTNYSEKIFSGPIHHQIRDIMDYLKRNVIKNYVRKAPTKAEAETFFNYPYQALEEVIVNAMYHRSFEEPRPNEIRIYKTFKKGIDNSDDVRRVEVRSFPGPLPPIDNTALQQGNFTSRNYRNIKLGDWLKNIRLAEKYATGIPTVLESLSKNGSPKPFFWTDDSKSEFLVTLRIHEDTPLERNSEQSRFESVALTNKQQQILEILKEDPLEESLLQSKFEEDIHNDLSFLESNRLLRSKVFAEMRILFITIKGIESLKTSF